MLFKVIPFLIIVIFYIATYDTVFNNNRFVVITQRYVALQIWIKKTTQYSDILEILKKILFRVDTPACVRYNIYAIK